MPVLEVSLGRGNTKVGAAATFSLPSQFTCPGASAWCLEHCYALRFEHVRPNCRAAYSRNLTLTWDPDRFVQTMCEIIPEDLPYLRIHVSGDFYDSSYVSSWIAICKARPNTQFWAYTRSWRTASILPALEELRALPNVQLLASCDTDMPDPPEGWRTAFIEDDKRANGLRCRHQQNEAESCLECGYCFNDSAGNVVFKVH